MLLVLLLMAAGQGAARTVNVSSAAAVNKTWSAGDTIVFAGGSYTNQALSLQGTGTAAKPIVLRAAAAGAVSLGGSSTLTIKGTYIEVQGFRFSGTYTGKSHIVQFESSATNCRLTDCTIESYNPTDATKDNKWVSIKGKQNRVDHCSFAGKANMGTLLVVWLEQNIVPKHRIDHNYFGYRNPNTDEEGKALNGQEIIRIGDSSTSMQEAACVIENNEFENCDGEIETISNKSCGNIYRNNTFLTCAGSLTLRHGNNCTVEGNIFLGNGKSATGGVRIIGEGHTVTNNYFQDLNSNNYRAAVCIVRGKENSALSEYFQVKNAVVSGNTFVNCKEAFCINYHSSDECTMPPLNTRIENNIVYNDASNTGNRIVTLAQTGGSVTWEANTYNAGKWKDYSPSATEWIRNKNMDKPEPATTDTATDRTEIISASCARKFIRNGLFLIEIDGKYFTLTGQPVN